MSRPSHRANGTFIWPTTTCAGRNRRSPSGRHLRQSSWAQHESTNVHSFILSSHTKANLTATPRSFLTHAPLACRDRHLEPRGKRCLMASNNIRFINCRPTSADLSRPLRPSELFSRQKQVDHDCIVRYSTYLYFFKCIYTFQTKIFTTIMTTSTGYSVGRIQCRDSHFLASFFFFCP